MKKNERRFSTQNKPTKELTKNSEMTKEFQSGTDMISSLIHEYLIKREYFKTIDSFQDEILAKVKQKHFYMNKFVELGENTLMRHFTNGNKEEFFKFWNRIIPNHIKVKEVTLEKLEFFIHIYFTIFPLLLNKPTKEAEMKKNMQDFKTYLESKEIEMSKTTEYLAYYALPYVKNPKDHPSYKQLFSPEWTKEIKERIKECLSTYIPNTKYPILYDLCINLGKDPLRNANVKHFLENFPKVDLNESEQEIKINTSFEQGRLLDEYNKLKQKEENTKVTFIESQKTWTSLAKNILTISFELLGHLGSSETVEEDYITKVKTRLTKYESFLNKNAEELDKNKNSSSILKEKDYTDSLEINARINSSKHVPNNIVNESLNNRSSNQIQENQSIHIDYDPNHLIDMISVRSLLAKVNAYGYDNDKISDKINLILREIRLRISRRKHQQIKSSTINSIVYHDLLGIRSKHVKIFHELLNKDKTVLETLKLMNMLTNDNKGRTYLLSKPSLLDEIVRLMIKEEGDTEIRQNCLGIVQKFTLRSEPQKRLIELDVIMWITNVFVSEGTNISEYTLEYGLALLMNLSLRNNGRDKCELVSHKLLKVMINYMKYESVQVRTCINGTLYSLLKRRKIKDEARTIGLEKILKAQLDNPNEQMKKQILYILDEIKNEAETDDSPDDEFNDDQNVEEEEGIEDYYNEEDSITNDLLIQHYENLGEFIIKSEYDNKEEIQRLIEYANSVANKHRANTSNNMSASIRPEEFDRPMRRPTTPMTNLSSTSNSQIFVADRKSIQTKIKPNLQKAEQNETEDNENIYPPEKIPVKTPLKEKRKMEKAETEEIPVDLAFGFEKKDKLSRSPQIK